MDSSDTSVRTAILVAIGVVVVVAVLGVVLAPDKTTEIIGFCTLIAVTLLSAFQQMRTAVKLEDIKRVGDNNHILLNSGHGALLKLHADTARALANLQGSAENLAAAERAEAELAQHEVKQGRVDAKEEAREAKDGPL